MSGNELSSGLKLFELVSKSFQNIHRPSNFFVPSGQLFFRGPEWTWTMRFAYQSKALSTVYLDPTPKCLLPFHVTINAWIFVSFNSRYIQIVFRSCYRIHR